MTHRRSPHSRAAGQPEASASETFDQMLNQELTAALVEAGDATWTDAQVDERIGDALQHALAAAGTRIIVEMDRHAAAGRTARRRQRRGFERRLHEAWGEAFARFDEFLAAFTEFGSEYYGSGRMDGQQSARATFRALAPLHARACRIAGEIIVLLGSGFPDGAMARWRTLHEVATVALVLAQEGDALATRYLAHDDVQRYKIASAWHQHAGDLDCDAPTDAEKAQLLGTYESRLTEYGKGFKTDFGWACALLGKDRPSFADIEAHVQLGRFRPYYAWASDGVHAGVRGLIPTGAEFSVGGPLLAGATNRGLADPGQNTAISLMQIAAAMLRDRSTPFWILSTQVLDVLARRCQDTFIRANAVVEERTRVNLASPRNAS